MSYNLLRRGRYSISGQIYFVTTVTRERKSIFEDFGLARMLISQMKQLHTEHAVESLAWVVMPDHLHWLFSLTPGHTLPDVMRKLKGRSSTLYRTTTGEHQALWQSNYHDHALRSEENLQAMARYIVANPLRKGLVASLKNYPHWDAVWL